MCSGLRLLAVWPWMPRAGDALVLVLLTTESALVQHSCHPAGGQAWDSLLTPSPAGQEDAEAWLCHVSTVWSGLLWEQHLLVGMWVLRAVLSGCEVPSCRSAFDNEGAGEGGNREPF